MYTLQLIFRSRLLNPFNEQEHPFNEQEHPFNEQEHPFNEQEQKITGSFVCLQ
jgi:hypothetical protein